MKNESENLSVKESLDIITTMIKQAQGNIKKNSFYFLFWGWVVTIANLGMFALIQLNYSRPYLVWLIAIPAWLITALYGYRQDKREKNLTHLDKIMTWLWISFGICVFTLSFFGYKINFQINPIILLVLMLPTLASGIILKFKPLIIGGIAFWIFGISGFLTPLHLQSLVGAVAIVCGFLIPGYMLKYKSEE